MGAQTYAHIDKHTHTHTHTDTLTHTDTQTRTHTHLLLSRLDLRVGLPQLLLQLCNLPTATWWWCFVLAR